MRISTIAIAILGTVATCLPTDPIEPQAAKTRIGSACTGPALTQNCTDLIVTTTNKCQKAMAGDFPFDRSIVSLEISATVPCAFFTLEACIHPEGTSNFYVQGPATIEEVPNAVANSIQAYLCGEVASRYLSDATSVFPDIPSDGEVESTSPEEQGVQDAVPRDLTVEQEDGRGATIYKQQNLKGDRVPADHTAITGTSFCVNLDDIYGDWDGKVRSLTVEPGYVCMFYDSHGCPANGKKLELGAKAHRTVMKTLTPEWDHKIHSVYCAKC